MMKFFYDVNNHVLDMETKSADTSLTVISEFMKTELIKT